MTKIPSSFSITASTGLCEEGARLLLLGLICLGGTVLLAQGQSSLSVGGAYVSARMLPSPARAYLAAFGTRIQAPGKERTTLTGTYTDKNGTGPARLVWQAPGSIRLDRPNSAPVLIYDPATGLLNANTITSGDADVLESLLDDAVEAFLYRVGQGFAYRLLGERFRSDNGTTVNFQGPWYDVYEVAGVPKAQPAAVHRSKHFQFNSDTKLLVMVQYTDSAGTRVTTEFNNWASSGGEAYPGQISRTENGGTVFTFTTQGATIGPAVADGLFSGSN